MLAACTRPTLPAPTELVPTLMPMPSPAPAAAAAPDSPQASPEPSDTGWLPAGAGLALRRLRVNSPSGLARISIVRVDPGLLRFRVGYAPDQPALLARWHQASGALALINGGFFDAQNRTTSLLISGGVSSGESYIGRGGMFTVDQAGAVGLRYLGEQAYDPAEPLAEALQSWPMLVRPGGTVAYTYEDGERARRSVIAIDRSGQVLLVAVATPSFTLRELAEWLAASDLEIDAALNLDGGSSTGLFLASDGQYEQIDAFVPLPIMLLVSRE